MNEQATHAPTTALGAAPLFRRAGAQTPSMAHSRNRGGQRAGDPTGLPAHSDEEVHACQSDGDDCVT